MTSIQESDREVPLSVVNINMASPGTMGGFPENPFKGTDNTTPCLILVVMTCIIFSIIAVCSLCDQRNDKTGLLRKEYTEVIEQKV